MLALPRHNPAPYPHHQKSAGVCSYGSLSAAPISPRSRVDQVEVQIKSAQKPRLRGLHPRFNPFECIFVYEKWCFHRSVMRQNPKARSVAS
jgi:hypothetical protein